MAEKHRVKGEKKVWVAYLLWPTLVGHRWYLGKLSPVYTLTFGYFCVMWFIDLFRIPEMVREYNSYIYQRAIARGLALGPDPGGEVFAGGTMLPSSQESQDDLSGRTLPGGAQMAGDLRLEDGPGTVPPTPHPSRRIKPLVIGLAAAVVIIIALVSSRVSSSDKDQQRETGAEATTILGSDGAEKLDITFTTPSGLTVNTPNTTLEGITEPGAQITVKGCANAPVCVWAGSDGKFTAALVLSEGSNLLVVDAEKDGKKGSSTFSITYQLDEATYKAQCKTIDFRALNKNPDAYKGQKYFATGQVVQIMEGLGTTNIRLNVTRDKWGYWDDTIYVTYQGSIPAYEESIIRVWGEVKGSYTYTSVAGWTITLPWVEARYVEVAQQ